MAKLLKIMILSAWTPLFAVCTELVPFDYGVCTMVIGTIWDGENCVSISGCSTINSNGVDDAEFFFNSIEILQVFVRIVILEEHHQSYMDELESENHRDNQWSQSPKELSVVCSRLDNSMFPRARSLSYTPDNPESDITRHLGKWRV